MNTPQPRESPAFRRGEEVKRPAPRSPTRIQRRRTAGWRMPADVVYVGRPGRFGNPFSTAGMLHQFILDRRHHPRAAIIWSGTTYPTDDEIRAALAGKDLACWCPPDRFCHADVLLRVAAGE